MLGEQIFPAKNLLDTHQLGLQQLNGTGSMASYHKAMRRGRLQRSRPFTSWRWSAETSLIIEDGFGAQPRSRAAWNSGQLRQIRKVTHPNEEPLSA